MSEIDQDIRIRDALERAKVITPEQVSEVREFSQANAVSFGRAAVALGYVNGTTLDWATASAAEVPTPAPAKHRWTGEPVAFTQPHSTEAEDYRSIRNAVALRWFKHPQGEKTLAVISADRREGRSVMAANIAVCCAQVGFRTLLVDCDMRNPSQHLLFNLDDNRLGIAAYLAEAVHYPDYQTIAAMPALSVLPVGGLPTNPQELLLRNSLNRFVAEAKTQFEMIIFDTPAAAVGSDYQIIGAAAGGALLVTHQALTRVRHAKNLVGQCEGFGIRVVGSAMIAEH